MGGGIWYYNEVKVTVGYSLGPSMVHLHRCELAVKPKLVWVAWVLEHLVRAVFTACAVVFVSIMGNYVSGFFFFFCLNLKIG